jgi:hypothetical protein
MQNKANDMNKRKTMSARKNSKPNNQSMEQHTCTYSTIAASVA